ncbi:RNA ligase [compost metagenome]
MDDLKYPRTYHLPTSPGLQSDDKRIPDLAPFRGERVIITEKMDGECTTLTTVRSYARSPDSGYHPSRDWLRAYHARRAPHIPDDWRISGEYLYARHSVAYTRIPGNALRSFFYGFGVWDDSNELLNWDTTLEILEMLEIEPVPVLYDGPFSDDVIQNVVAGLDTSRQEGFVIRLADRMPYPAGAGSAARFFDGIAKWVRSSHVINEKHWMAGPVVPNELREGLDATP